ncbi:hypothetical protein T265_06037 [Opisthorchis viverrini]|uniref:Uncharacterized protein n=1 Tax=Opisthorchis viverrini TaxID=6198 RepID=A0A075AEI6_OPIVI|nr:hypothetical protein T265_06037 [Opisthorchis viverrini]KER26754.1 hypothetical protein T265_06037 [Opisthorchis viverrini]
MPSAESTRTQIRLGCPSLDRNSRVQTKDLPVAQCKPQRIQSINQFISYKPCAIGTFDPAATGSITGKQKSETHNQALKANEC